MNPLRLIVCFATAACLSFATTRAHAGLDLTWNDCATDGGAGETTLDCDGAEGGEHSLFGTFQTRSDVPQFVALDISIDISTNSAEVPSFWQFAPGECNFGNMTLEDARFFDCASADPAICFITGAQCENGFATDFVPNVFCGGAAFRLVGSIFRDATQPVALSAMTSYFGFRLRFWTSGATESGGACTGCTDPGVLVWNSALVSGLNDSGGVMEEPIEGPGLVDNCAVFNKSALCGAVATVNKTWGQVKSFYR